MANPRESGGLFSRFGGRHKEQETAQGSFRVETKGAGILYKFLKLQKDLSSVEIGHPTSNGERFFIGKVELSDEIFDGIMAGFCLDREDMAYEFNALFLHMDSGKTEVNLASVAHNIQANLGDPRFVFQHNLLSRETVITFKDVTWDGKEREFVLHEQGMPGFCLHVNQRINGTSEEEFKETYEQFGTVFEATANAFYREAGINLSDKTITLEPPRGAEDKLEILEGMVQRQKRMLTAGGVLDEDFSELIRDTILLRERPKETFDDVGGLEKAKEELQTVVMALKNPEAFRKWGTYPSKGILLHGEPGTGKTLLAKALAHEADAAIYVVEIADIVHSLYGRSEKLIQAVFEDAKKNQPVIVFFDEIDALAAQRDKSMEVTSRIVSVLLTNMQGLEERGDNVVVIGATNRPNAVDNALLRPGRFDQVIEIPLPDVKSRATILAIHLKAAIERAGIEIIDPSFNIDEIVQKTPGMSGADLKEILRRALTNKVKAEIAGERPGKLTTGEVVTVISDYERIKQGKIKVGFA